MPIYLYHKPFRESITLTEVNLVDNTTPAYYLTLDSDSDGTALNADRTLIFDVNNADRVIDLGGDLTLSGSNTVATWTLTNLNGPTGDLLINEAVIQDIKLWSGIGSGNPYFYIYGFKSGDAVKYGRMWVDTAGDFNIDGEEKILLKTNNNTRVDMSSSAIGIKDNYRIDFGNGSDSSIEYDEAGDDTWHFSLPAGGLSMRTAPGDTDNSGLLKVAKVVVTAADLTVSAATDNQALTAAALPANAVLLSAKYVLDVQFSGGTVNDVDCEIGLAGDENGLIIPGAHNLTSDSVGIEKTTKGAYWDGTDSNSGTYWNSSAQTWVAYFTAVGDTWNNITTGQITFYVWYVHAPQT